MHVARMVIETGSLDYKILISLTSEAKHFKDLVSPNLFILFFFFFFANLLVLTVGTHTLTCSMLCRHSGFICKFKLEQNVH